MDAIHGLGLKVGLYSTPWITSYGNHIGGSSDNPEGAWDKSLQGGAFRKFGKFSFATNDAKQWAAWGFDYLKYDWRVVDVPHVEEMSQALKATGRDFIFSLSNAAPFAQAADWARLAHCWRTTGDIWDYWTHSDEHWRFAVSEIGFSQDHWAPYAGPGHWNDPDMLVLGWVGWGPKLHATNLTPDEQYSHVSLWCLLSSPLLIGCDLERLDPFTIGLLSNDEVLAVNQDSLGKQGIRLAAVGTMDVFKKDLEDSSSAVGFFNRGDTETTMTFNKLDHLGIAGKDKGKLLVRDLWRQKDLPDVHNFDIKVTVPAHGVTLLKFTPTKR